MKRCGTFADHLHRWTPLPSSEFVNITINRQPPAK